MPRTNAVLPAPRSPCRSTTSPARNRAAKRSPAADVSSSLFVTTVSGSDTGEALLCLSFGATPSGEFQDGVTETCGEIPGNERDVALVSLREIAGRAVQIDRQLTRG